MTAMFVVIFMDQWLKEKESYIFITWTWNFFSLSPCIRTGLFYDSDHDFDYRLIDIITQKA